MDVPFEDQDSGGSDAVTDGIPDTTTPPSDSGGNDSAELDTSVDSTIADSATDGAPDGETSAEDAPLEADVLVGDTATDALPDTGSDTLTDSGADTVADTVADTGADTLADTSVDAADTGPCTGKADGTSCDGSDICKSGSCVAASCGDGITTTAAGEQCDDGNAIRCDGCESCSSRNWLVVPSSAYGHSDTVASALSTTGSACYEAWARVDAGAPADAIYMSSTSAGADSHFIMRCFSSLKKVSFAVENGSPPIEAITSIDCADGVFHHVAGCRTVTGSTATLTLYWDGAQVATASGAASKVGTPTSVVIGGVSYGKDGLGGRIDEVRISSSLRYSGPFTPARRFATDASTTALWHFDEGTGTTASDASGGGHDMTLVGTSWANDTGYKPGFCDECAGSADGTTCGTSGTKVCSGGICSVPVCSVDEYRCAGDTLQKCGPTRLSFDPVATCGPGLCDAVGKECDDCKTGDKDCLASVPRTCSATGHWSSGTACAGTTPVCFAGECRACSSIAAPAGGSASASGVESLLSTTGDACYEGWVKLTDAAPSDANYILSSLSAGNQSHFNLLCFGSAASGGARLSFGVENGAAGFLLAEKAMSCADGTWHHVAGCRSVTGANVTLKLFWDGAKVAETTGSSARIASPAPVVIGGYSFYAAASQPGLRGLIDEVRISSTLRYTGTFTPARRFATDANTVALWHFDEASGTTSADDSAGTHPMTLSSAVTWSSSCAP